MRLASLILVLACTATPLLVAQAPTAPATAPVCEGTPATVRVSEIKRGTMPTFLQAVTAHQAWYRNHGSKDSIFATRITLRDPETKATHNSETEVLTFHLVPDPSQHLPENDDAWKAFVTMYKDSSTIKNEYRICMPKPAP